MPLEPLRVFGKIILIVLMEAIGVSTVVSIDLAIPTVCQGFSRHELRTPTTHSIKPKIKRYSHTMHNKRRSELSETIKYAVWL